MATAWQNLKDFLGDGEAIEAISFGPWGWGGFCEPDNPAVAEDKQGKPMSPEAAKPLMQSWSFYGGYGSPRCYATYIWTNMRIIWVTQYEGSTVLDSAPRNPIEVMPDMPGG